MPLAVSIVPHVVKNQSMITMPPTASVHEAAKTMMKHNISSMLVVDENDRLIGIVTERDMAHHVIAENLKAKDISLQAIMTEHPKTVEPEVSVYDALEYMREIKVRHLPLVKNDCLVGMVSMRDVRNYIGVLVNKQKIGPIERMSNWIKMQRTD